MIVYYLPPLAHVHPVCILYSQFFGGWGVKYPQSKKVVDSLSAPDNFSQHQYRTDDFSFLSVPEILNQYRNLTAIYESVLQPDSDSRTKYNCINFNFIIGFN